MSSLILPSFSASSSDKIASGIEVSGNYTLIMRGHNTWRAAIADEPIDSKVDGKKFFCVRVENNAGSSKMMFGFTPMETLNSKKDAYFGKNGFTGCGICSFNGYLQHPVDKQSSVIGSGDSENAQEIIVILEISNNGTKKEIRFLCDGKESESTDVSEILKEDFLFPAICVMLHRHQITTIPIDQINTRTPEIDELIKEYQQQQKGNTFLRFVSISDFFRQNYPLLQQHEELGIQFLQQREIIFRGLMATLQK
jgi:hypothetical protein